MMLFCLQEFDYYVLIPKDLETLLVRIPKVRFMHGFQKI